MKGKQNNKNQENYFDSKKRVIDLEGNFIIPSYQRGYRWREEEVSALLDDLYDFSIENSQGEYCLQPLIVQKDKENADTFYVVDGQQRLTTIFIILKMLEKQTGERPPFSLSYETANTDEVLKNLDDYNKENNGDFSNYEIKYDNPNTYYVSNAVVTINNWINKKINDPGVKTTVASVKFRLFATITERVFFVYDVLENKSTADEPEKIFTRINMGKIPLTNAELIKALLLSDENLKLEEDIKDKESYLVNEGVNSLRNEIALQWNEIEQNFHDDDFWCFVSSPDRHSTRIELLFEYWARFYKKRYNYEDIKETDDKWIFLVYYKIIKAFQKNRAEFKSIKELWADIKNLYDKLKSIYHEPKTYHLVGYLIATGKKLEDMLYPEQKKKNMLEKKGQFKQRLLNETRNRILDKGEVLNKDFLEELSYTVASEKDKMKKLLLLFNIAAVFKTKDYHFPFGQFKMGKWDLEHINAKKEDISKDEELKNINKTEDNSLGNICLLNREINQDNDYKTRPFNIKRQIIKKYDDTGKFIPICTRHVFYKNYSSFDYGDDNNENTKLDEIQGQTDAVVGEQTNNSYKTTLNIYEWNESDEELYIRAIERVLNDFWSQNLEVDDCEEKDVK